MIVNLFKQIRWWNWAIPFLVVILGLLALLLVRDATTAILESADGEFEEVVLDPLAPGYETYVTSTPTHLMIIENRDQEFVSAALLSLFVNEIGGTAVILPGELLIASETSIEEAYNQGTIENFLTALGSYLWIGFEGFSIINEDNIENYSLSVGPLTVSSPDPLRKFENGEPVVVYEAGEILLESSRVFEYLTWENESESAYNRWLRHKNFWENWILSIEAEKLLTSGDLQKTDGLQRILGGISSGEFVMQNLDLLEFSEETEYLSVNEGFLASLILEMIPFPISPSSGERATVKIVDGVGGLDIPNIYVPRLVGAGAEIKVIGNADQFGVSETIVTYYDEADYDFADAFSNVLAGSVIVFEPLPESAVDISVVIGLSSVE